MPTFTLNTLFDPIDLGVLYTTGTNVVVAKPSSGGGAPNVAWIVFRPFESNTMTWEENYGIYASTQSIQSGAVLTQMAKTPFPATDGTIYPMLSSGAFGPPEGGGTAGSYTALNSYNNVAPGGPGFLTFGLFQNASVNGSPMDGNAVSAAPVLYQSTAVITPYTTVYIWTQSQVVSNSVVTNVTSQQTVATFGGSIDTITLTYDPLSGKFLPKGGLVLQEGLSIDYVLPALG